MMVLIMGLNVEFEYSDDSHDSDCESDNSDSDYLTGGRDDEEDD